MTEKPEQEFKEMKGSRFFGREQDSAGAYILARDTGRILALQRSPDVNERHTWSIASGAIDGGETPEDAVAREIQEELGYDEEFDAIIPLAPAETKDGEFKFHNFLVVVDKEFAPELNNETLRFEWVNSLQDWPGPPHPGIATLQKDAESMNIIAAEQSNCDPTAEENRAAKTYPSTVFHLVNGGLIGDALEPRQANPNDPRPYVYATDTLAEVLPFSAPNGNRFFNKRLPGTDEWVTLLPGDRKSFEKMLEDKGITFGGTIYRIQSQNFKKHPVKYNDGSKQCISEKPVPLSDKDIYAEITSLENAMHYGLHVIFTNQPLNTDDKNYQMIKDAVDDPDFPKKLKEKIADGTFTYENARLDQNGSIHARPSPLLTTESAEAPKQASVSKPKI